MGTHYAPSQDPIQLSDFAFRTAAQIRNELPATHIMLCYRGMSGTSMATALMLALFQSGFPKDQLGMVYVRKKNESSHGRSVEVHNLPDNPSVKTAWIFVDELICSGETFRAVDDGLVKHAVKSYTDHWGTASTPGQKDLKPRLTHAALTNVLREQCVGADRSMIYGKRPEKEAPVVKPKEVKAETVVSGSASELFPILKELSEKEKKSCRLSGFKKTSKLSAKGRGSHAVASRYAKKTSARTRLTLRRPKR